MPSLLGCLFIGVAIGLLCRATGLCLRAEGAFFACAVTACGAVLGGLAAAPLLGFVSSDATHFGFAEAAGAVVGSSVVIMIGWALRICATRAAGVNPNRSGNVVPRTDMT